MTTVIYIDIYYIYYIYIIYIIYILYIIYIYYIYIYIFYMTMQSCDNELVFFWHALLMARRGAGSVLAYGALSYQCMRPQATSACGLKLLEEDRDLY
jgi:hypothetical protein